MELRSRQQLSTHDRSKISERRPKVSPRAEETVLGFYATDAVVDMIYKDIVNGYSQSEVFKKFQEGGYLKNPDKMSQRLYYNAALCRFKMDNQEELDNLRNIYYTRYENLFKEAVKKGDIYNARGILDSMTKTFGIAYDRPGTTIKFGNKQNEFEITFGFGIDEAEEMEKLREKSGINPTIRIETKDMGSEEREVEFEEVTDE